MASSPAPSSTQPPGTPPRLPFSARPFFENKARAFWTLQAVGWSGYLMLRGVSSVSNGLTLTSIIPVIIEAIVGYCITLLLSTLYGYYRRIPRVIGLFLTIATLAAATFLYAVLDAFSFSFIQTATPGITITRMLGFVFLNFVTLAGWSALYFGINFYLIVEEQIDQMQHLENQASSAQLAMLRYQLNPHFLFNTLNSISTLVLLKQTERANAMLSRLSSFLRYTLANEPTAHVTVAQEMETLKLYLEIEKMRFEDRMRPKFDIDPRAERARLPSLLLQPLVENAIKYAVTPQEEGAEICVTVRLAGERVQIAVSDTGPGLIEGRISPSLSTGVGLANIRDRLAQAYGPDHRFETRSTPAGGFSVEIEIPYQLEDVNREAA
ncbi:MULTISPECIES: sensor histidine kinase [Sphingomonas]|jgi:sensor histidine kinase YesM|uniref:Histidine kinase/DNA gyrase B/HSP90-like ATPase n=1 Tax=Sphingomonas aerolata TaxID=185951 RepID=A0A2T4YU44_9SPHN|nr:MULTISPECIES: sensor histidine kinase [Sphingomonas]MBB3589039.1 sensor histidine kinase YesM [Sphingomonas sp. BK481]MBD8640334.1 sensor histidine kinase [Sphingomonas sp. CFBP 13733]MBP2514515.1 sensor histidine kinase YesM [Sphingomonas sp. PvP018]PTM47336.1 histidine kinase/DNA gyrase B/HSP90-like ATPase [Sphingomonas aerolata]